MPSLREPVPSLSAVVIGGLLTALILLVALSVAAA